MSWNIQRRITSLHGAERVEEYKPGGYHPVNIGDILHATNNIDRVASKNSYRVLKKLDSSWRATVWLARDDVSVPLTLS